MIIAQIDVFHGSEISNTIFIFSNLEPFNLHFNEL